MLTIENIYNFRVIERHPGVFINNQRILAMKPFFIDEKNSKNSYYLIYTNQEKIVTRAKKKLKVSMIPFKNDWRNS